MKQVSMKAIRKLALTKQRVNTWKLYVASDWFKENAMDMAAIALGLRSSANYGEWPKGWKAAMKSEVKRISEERAIQEFMDQEVLQLDGAYWLKRIETIEEMRERIVLRLLHS